MLGSKIVLDVSKGEKNASQRPLEKRIRKSIEKLRSGREVRGGWVVNGLLSDPTLKISRKQHLEFLEEFKTRSFKPSTYSKFEASSHQLKLLLHSRFHFDAPLALEMNNFASQPGGPKGPADSATYPTAEAPGARQGPRESPTQLFPSNTPHP